MHKRFLQYLCSLFALLTIFNWYYWEIQQKNPANTPSSIQTTLDILKKAKKNNTKSFLFLKDHEDSNSYSISRPKYRKFRTNLFENNTENDENDENSVSSKLITLFKDRFSQPTSDFTFHDKQIAVSLAQSEHLIPLRDDLYIQYRVIRL